MAASPKLVDRIGCIHIVDDDQTVLDSLLLLTRVLGFKGRAYSSSSVFLETTDVSPGDVLLFDLQMPDLDGFALYRQWRMTHSDTPALLMTGHGNSDVEKEARILGFVSVLHKPFSEDQLLAALDAAAQTER